MKCFYCKGDFTLEHETFTAKLPDGNIIVIDNVPTKVCEKCGQSFYSNDVSKQIEIIVNKMRSKVNKIALVQYTETSAA